MTAEGLIKERQVLIQHDWDAYNVIDTKVRSVEQISIHCCVKIH